MYLVILKSQQEFKIKKWTATRTINTKMNYNIQNYLADGATIIPRNKSRPTTSGWDGGISKICFKKNVFSSEICQNITIWQTAKNLIYVHVGSNHLTCVQLTGVNCITALFSLPVVEWISLKYRNKISSNVTIFLYSLINCKCHANLPQNMERSNLKCTLKISFCQTKFIKFIF